MLGNGLTRAVGWGRAEEDEDVRRAAGGSREEVLVDAEVRIERK